MDTRYAVEVRNAAKSFKVYRDKGTTLKERVIFAKRNAHERRTVLNGISFNVEPGQAVGIIGKNGCGKSTTLKLLSRILRPDSGVIALNGRVSCLIELGAGFHPDMSGRENIYINASIFGLSRRETDERLDDIIRFSELEEFIDNPVRTYSSGMYMRLAFSVAINVDADVLLVDEILAVGDVSFQKKCFERLREIKEQGTTIIIVSHDMNQLYGICDRLIWLEDGRVREDGAPLQVGTHYLDLMEDVRIRQLSEESRERLEDDGDRSILSLCEHIHPEARRMGDGEVRFTRVELCDSGGTPCYLFDTGDPVTLRLRYETVLDHPKVNFNMDFVRDNWQYCYGSCFAKPGDELPVLEAEGEVAFRIDALMLLPGKYYLDVGINGEHGELYDNVRNIMQITVRDYPNNEFGPCTFRHSWEIGQ